jgi:1-phosphatidylinositol-3-phosphate 5-kinase
MPGRGDDRTINEKGGVSLTRPSLKGGQSMIPRSVGGRSSKKDTRVSALAKHFEQLSREFERERLRERRVVAAKSRQSRATPMASSKPIVEVYRDVLEAVEEREPSDDDTVDASPPSKTSPETASTTGNATKENSGPNSSEASSMGGAGAHRTETVDRKAETNPTASDTEGEGADAAHHEPPAREDGHTDGPSHLVSPLESHSDLRLDLPKHERSSLMKMLTNFWAERSASGWDPLDYPLNASDHVFLDSDVIVREDEPSSLIAFALSSEDYQAKLKSIRQQDGGTMSEKDFDNDDQRLERSLLRSTGTHLKYQFQEGSAKMLCKVFYAEQFDAVRRKCGVSDRIVESLSRCVKWDSKGGKSRSVFLKTLDERLVLKSLSVVETQAFLKFAPAYFQIMSEALFHEVCISPFSIHLSTY